MSCKLLIVMLIKFLSYHFDLGEALHQSEEEMTSNNLNSSKDEEG